MTKCASAHIVDFQRRQNSATILLSTCMKIFPSKSTFRTLSEAGREEGASTAAAARTTSRVGKLATASGRTFGFLAQARGTGRDVVNANTIPNVTRPLPRHEDTKLSCLEAGHVGGALKLRSSSATMSSTLPPNPWSSISAEDEYKTLIPLHAMVLYGRKTGIGVCQSASRICNRINYILCASSQVLKDWVRGFG